MIVAHDREQLFEPCRAAPKCPIHVKGLVLSEQSRTTVPNHMADHHDYVPIQMGLPSRFPPRRPTNQPHPLYAGFQVGIDACISPTVSKVC